MGKSLQSAPRFHEVSQIVSSAKVQRPHRAQPRLPNRVAIPAAPKSAVIKVQLRLAPSPAPLKMETSEEEQCQCRTPLAHVVADCAKRWFRDTLKEAKAGDSDMQVLVGQMYCSGYAAMVFPEIVVRDMLGLVKHQEVEIQSGKSNLRKIFTFEQWSTSKWVKEEGGEKKLPMGYIYEAMDRAKEVIAKTFNEDEDMYKDVFEIIDRRWDVQLYRPLHAAGYYLNLKFSYSNPNIENDKEVNAGLI